MTADLRPRSRAWPGKLRRAMEERLWDPLRGRRPCPVLASLRQDPRLAGRPIEQDLGRIVRIIVGRDLSRRLMGGDHPRRQSLTDFIERGARQARSLLPYVQPHQALLEFGGGVGRLGRAIAPRVHRLVSVDVDPLMKVYGARLSPGIDFRDRDELPEAAEFDGAYSIAVFFHLTLSEQRTALEYVHRRLKPGGWFLVDVMLGPCTTGPLPERDNVGATAFEDFRALYEPLFSATRVPLFNAGFLLRKRAEDSPPGAGRAAEHYVIDERSLVFDVQDSEVVVVNFDTGSYYILEGTGSVVWQMLAAGLGVAEITAVLLRHFAGEPTVIERSVAEFLGELAQEALVVAGSPGARAETGRFDEARLAGPRQPFSTPVMHRYADMQSLLQTDPIRESDESGWPRPRPGPPGARA